MVLLIAGLILFIAVHAVPSMGGVRATLVARVGQTPWRVLHGLVTVAALALVIAGYARAHPAADLLWAPPHWGRHATLFLMGFAWVGIAAALIPCRIRRLVKQPAMFAVATWAVAHLFVRSDGPSVAMFGAIGLFALWKWVELVRRHGPRTDQTPRQAWGPGRDLAAVALGCLFYVVMLWAHAWLIGPVLIT